MSAFIPNTTVTVRRGIEADEFGDVRDSDTVWARGIPAAISEIRQRTYLPVEQRGGVSEEFLIRLRPDTDIVEQDRLTDESNDTVYQVQTVSSSPNLVGKPDVRATAIRISTHSVSP
jgi:hypothetical protein